MCQEETKFVGFHSRNVWPQHNDQIYGDWTRQCELQRRGAFLASGLALLWVDISKA